MTRFTVGPSLLLLLAILVVPAPAISAGWVLVAPPRDEKGRYLRDAPVGSTWTQVSAFDSATQCEVQREVEINFWRDRFQEMPNTEEYASSKRDFFQRWQDEFLIRCMPYDLWWKTQQQAPR
jgi:hypothetical protein